MNEVKGEDMLYAKVNKLTMKEVFVSCSLYFSTSLVKIYIIRHLICFFTTEE